MGCSYTESGRGAMISGSVAIKNGDEKDLQSAVAYIGPVAVAVDAQSNAFRVSKHIKQSILGVAYSLFTVF